MATTSDSAGDAMAEALSGLDLGDDEDTGTRSRKRRSGKVTKPKAKTPGKRAPEASTDPESTKKASAKAAAKKSPKGSKASRKSTPAKPASRKGPAMAITTVDALKKDMKGTTSSAKDLKRQALELQFLYEEQKDDGGREEVKAYIEEKHPKCVKYLPEIFGEGATTGATTTLPGTTTKLPEGLPAGATPIATSDDFIVVQEAGGNGLKAFTTYGKDLWGPTGIEWRTAAEFGREYTKANRDLSALCQRKLSKTTTGASEGWKRFVQVGR